MFILVSESQLEQKNVIKALERENIRDRVKVIVGGAPVTKDFANEIGADGYDATAVGAVKIVRKFIGK